MFSTLRGVYAAALTPLSNDYKIDLEALPTWLDFLAARGCHGVLLFGTTGEGPSFAPSERKSVLQSAEAWRKSHPDFKVLAGTGTPSLQETIELTQTAFETGVDGVVVLPPYYFRKVNDEGLYRWFSEVLVNAVPEGKACFGYHFPSVSGVPLSLELLTRLKEAFPQRLAGIKDSSGDAGYARQLGALFGDDLVVLTGNDALFSLALDSHAGGCITAMANLYSPDLRIIWENHQKGEPQQSKLIQERLTTARTILDRYLPFPPLLKALVSRLMMFPRWSVRPPLLPLRPELEMQVEIELQDAQVAPLSIFDLAENHVDVSNPG